MNTESEKGPLAIVVEITDDNRDAMVTLALATYLGEQCKFCDRVFDTLDSLKESVFAGHHAKGRVACQRCWDERGLREMAADDGGA